MLTVEAFQSELAVAGLAPNFWAAMPTSGHAGSLNQWRSQVIGISRAPAVHLTIALTTLALAYTYTGQTLARHVPGQAQPSLRHWSKLNISK